MSAQFTHRRQWSNKIRQIYSVWMV